VSLDIADVVRDVSTPGERASLIQEADRVLNRGGAQVHVTLRRGQVLVSSEFLNRSRRCAPHRQVRTPLGEGTSRWVRSLSVDDVLAAIGVKAGRLSSYQRAVDRVRLLLVVDRTREASMFSWIPIESPMPSIGYEGVYLYLHPDQAFHVAW
jgi:hypothetical protein